MNLILKKNYSTMLSHGIHSVNWTLVSCHITGNWLPQNQCVKESVRVLRKSYFRKSLKKVKVQHMPFFFLNVKEIQVKLFISGIWHFHI